MREKKRVYIEIDKCRLIKKKMQDSILNCGSREKVRFKLN